MKSLIQRAITGIILVLIIIISVSWNAYSFIALVLVINLFSILEFYRLLSSAEILPRKTVGVILSLSLLITCMLAVSGKGDWKILLINIPVAFGVFIAELYKRAKYPFHNLALTFLAIICITVPLCFFSFIAFLPIGIYDYRIILGYFFILWASDSGAYVIGSNFGKHPLFKRISPKKTWEGSIGGVGSAILIAWINAYFFTILDLREWMIIAVIIVITGTFGDFIKSLLKRSLSLKDSGSILPGHGGMLDRFDTLFGSAAFVFCYLILFRYA